MEDNDETNIKSKIKELVKKTSQTDENNSFRLNKEKLQMEKELKDVIEETKLRNVFWALPKQFTNISKYVVDL